MRILVKALPFALLGAIAVQVVMAFAGRTSAPHVIFRTLDGEQISTSDLSDKVVLINFWATSCVTCVKEMPMLASTQRKFESQGFVTLAVAMSYDPPNQVLAFAMQNKLPFKVALDVDGAISRAFDDVLVTPTSFLLSKNGEIAKRFVGEPQREWLHAAIAQELAR